MSGEQSPFSGLDRLLHEPARTLIASILYSVEKVDFLYLLRETGLTKGNLSAHISKLEEAGYVQVEKTFRGKLPQTLIGMTTDGRAAFKNYRAQLKQVVEHISNQE